MINIRNARCIANLVNHGRFKGFRPEIRAAFHRLHMSAERGNRDDRALAQILWDCAGTWDSQGDLKPVKDGAAALFAAMQNDTIT